MKKVLLVLFLYSTHAWAVGHHQNSNAILGAPQAAIQGNNVRPQDQHRYINPGQNTQRQYRHDRNTQRYERPIQQEIQPDGSSVYRYGYGHRGYDRRRYDNNTFVIQGNISTPYFEGSINIPQDSYTVRIPVPNNNENSFYDNNGNQVFYSVDDNGDTIYNFTDENGNTIYYYIDGSGNTIYYYYDENGNAVNFTYDANGNAVITP